MRASLRSVNGFPRGPCGRPDDGISAELADLLPWIIYILRCPGKDWRRLFPPHANPRSESQKPIGGSPYAMLHLPSASTSFCSAFSLIRCASSDRLATG